MKDPLERTDVAAHLRARVKAAALSFVSADIQLRSFYVQFSGHGYDTLDPPHRQRLGALLDQKKWCENELDSAGAVLACAIAQLEGKP
jgi:hypothetical protein